ncbi:hypothetical protein HID58_020436 [Brassica napus]|uniref:C2 domain-containing protein n=1 Tax=Brassica napus TaxID=3708 RepID=A0ABQ7XGU8_BRANA|nr:hypothetical protein HID58_020436 [Brassica napus]
MLSLLFLFVLICFPDSMYRLRDWLWSSRLGQTHEAASSRVLWRSYLLGKTVVDELAFSISGENKHYESSTNPAAHDRIPGALPVELLLPLLLTLNRHSWWVRVPAGYCGVLGFKSSKGAISNTGIIPVSSSLDSVDGLIVIQTPTSRWPCTLAPSICPQRNPRQIIVADDYFQLLKIPVDRITQVGPNQLKSSSEHQSLENYIESKVPSLKEFTRTKAIANTKVPTSRLLANVMQLLQRHEFLQNHGDWINTVKPAIGPVISSQVCDNAELTNEEIENLNTIRNQTRVAINSLLKDDGVLVIPTMPTLPPKLVSLSIASISGCCQVTVPLGHHEKCPVSVSFLARHGGDRFLLDTVQTIIIADPKSSKKTISLEESAEIAKEKWQKAIGLYSEAIKLSEKNATYYSNRAAAYLEIGSFLLAEEDCTKAITLDKKNVKAYLRRGTARNVRRVQGSHGRFQTRAGVGTKQQESFPISRETAKESSPKMESKYYRCNGVLAFTKIGFPKLTFILNNGYRNSRSSSNQCEVRIRIKRGVNLAVRDINSSDPYVVKLKTRVINKDVNPEWNEDLTLSVTDPTLTVLLTVYDHDMFSKDDKMGDAEFEIKPGTIVTTVQPCRRNCLAEESKVTWVDGKLVQDLVLRLRHVECGEVEAQLQWIDLPGSKGL